MAIAMQVSIHPRLLFYLVDFNKIERAHQQNYKNGKNYEKDTICNLPDISYQLYLDRSVNSAC